MTMPGWKRLQSHIRQKRAKVGHLSPPPIYPGKNLNIKGLNGLQPTFSKGWRMWAICGSTFRIANSRGVFPHLEENYMLSGIRWLGGISENYRLTIKAVHFSGANKGLPKKSTNARYGFGYSNSGTALKQTQGWYRPDLKGHDFTGCGPSLRA